MKSAGESDSTLDVADTPPQLVKSTPPPYPDEVLSQKIKGEVLLKVIIDAEGRATVYEVVKSVPELDRVAIETVEETWLFEPGTKDGKPVACVAEILVEFKLR